MIESHAGPLINDNSKQKLPQNHASNKQLLKHSVQFISKDLRVYLELIIHKMSACVDSHPFRQSVDSVALNILDNSTIIKHPMDISTMYNNLLHGKYKTSLEFCNNAWLYNKKITRVYTVCVQNFRKNQLGCQILRDGNYYFYNNPEPSRLNLSGDKYIFCAKYLNSVKSVSILVVDDLTEILVDIPKTLFLPAKNDIQKPEKMIACIVCTCSWPQICALHLDQIWLERFICNMYIREYNIQGQENRYVAHRLTVTNLVLQLEQRVNDSLHNQGCHRGRVTIHILAASDKISEVKPR
ncbi:unnamed protein product [Rotaria sp. Silwood2]|nr:unnamed protein product [Rotaria sp. Silwood2]CAF4224627.1 unnamed protein product [Rotaria sp. Silwood2]